MWSRTLQYSLCLKAFCRFPLVKTAGFNWKLFSAPKRIPLNFDKLCQTRYCSQAAETQVEQHENSEDERALDELKITKVIPVVERSLPTKYNCSGCGAVLQSVDPTKRGFIPKEKLKEWHDLVDNPSKTILGESEYDNETGIVQGSRDFDDSAEDNSDEFTKDIEDYFPEEGEDSASDIASLVCKRCFSLENYNSALSITLQQDDYLRHLKILKNQRALLVLVLDVSDFPACVFPNLKNLISTKSSVLIVANKIDLFPVGLKPNFWIQFRDHIIEECVNSGLAKSTIVGVRFISVKQSKGILELSNEIVKKWGNRGDVYLMGCTNVGKSSLFNKLLGHLCGSKPGELNTDTNLLAPKATISLWPGTTLGLLSFPLMSVGKRRRLLARQKDREEKIALGLLDPGEDYDDSDDAFRTSVENEALDYQKSEENEEDLDPVDAEEILDKYNLRRKKVVNPGGYEPPKNRFWLHDTPGAINESQLINHLTTKELTVGLPKKPFKPRTLILKPGQCLFLGGLARIDYEEGPVSAYFTFFAWSFLNIHATKIKNAAAVYDRQLSTTESIFTLPLDFESRGAPFPQLEGKTITVSGTGWKESAVDLVLSSAGWVSVTVGTGNDLTLRVYTPLGKGIHVRKPPLFPGAINERGKRERYGTRTAYRGLPRKRVPSKR